MVTTDFGAEIELTLFLRMHAKEIAKSLGKCVPIEENRGRWSKWQGQVFDRKLLHSRFCACGLKKPPKHSENVFRHTSYSRYIGITNANDEIRFFDQGPNLQRIESFS